MRRTSAHDRTPPETCWNPWLTANAGLARFTARRKPLWSKKGRRKKAGRSARGNVWFTGRDFDRGIIHRRWPTGIKLESCAASCIKGPPGKEANQSVG
jgi:hypothetical protein